MNLDKLKGKLLEKKKTYKKCAKYLGMSITTFSSKMNGKTKWYVEELNSLGDFLELTPQERVEIFLK